jgi:hypothetical protein
MQFVVKILLNVVDDFCSRRMFEPFEHRSQPLLSRAAFARRVVRYAGVAFGILVVSLVLGMLGYHWFEGMRWLDAFLNAAMILGGMGPVDQLKTAPGKVFAGAYALFAGIVFLGAVGVLLAPIIHRIQHRFHLELETEIRGGEG